MKKLIFSLTLVILSIVLLVSCNFLFPDRSENTDDLENAYTMADFKNDWPEAIKVRISDLDEYNIVGSSFDTEATIEYIWLVPTTEGYIWILPMHSIQGN